MATKVKRTTDGAKRWLLLSVASLLFGGFLSLALVIGRTPFINHYINDPLYAKRCLVVHVTLTLTCWFLGYIAALFYLIPGKPIGIKRIGLAIAGIVLFTIGGMAPGAEPILSNYIPVVHHPLFLTGTALFIIAVCLAFFDRRLFAKLQTVVNHPLLSPDSLIGIKTAVVTLLFASVVLLYSVATTPQSESLFSYYEVLFWGSGHLFQLANIAALISVWLILYKKSTGESLLSVRSALWLFSIIFVPVLFSPFLLKDGTMGEIYYSGFTYIMRWGTWPSASIVMLTYIYKVIQLPKPLRSRVFSSAEFSGFIASSILLILGFYLGTRISYSSTLIPAHYHATIGAVTIAYLVVTYVLLNEFGYAPKLVKNSKWVKIQPLVYASGQFIFSIGFAYAGLHGLGRKVYGEDQLVSKLEQHIGLGIMGVGGVLAIIGGALFFMVLYRIFKKDVVAV